MQLVGTDINLPVYYNRCVHHKFVIVEFTCRFIKSHGVCDMPESFVLVMFWLDLLKVLNAAVLRLIIV